MNWGTGLVHIKVVRFCMPVNLSVCVCVTFSTDWLLGSWRHISVNYFRLRNDNPYEVRGCVNIIGLCRIIVGIHFTLRIFNQKNLLNSSVKPHRTSINHRLHNQCNLKTRNHPPSKPNRKILHWSSVKISANVFSSGTDWIDWFLILFARHPRKEEC